VPTCPEQLFLVIVNKNTTTAIVFNSGSYGTYLEWCLTTLVSNGDIQEPFTTVGNSHAFHGKHLINMQGWRRYINSGSRYKFVRLHPKTTKDERIVSNLAEIGKDAQSIVYLYPDQDRILLGINNFFFKIWDNWLARQFDEEIDLMKIYSNWPVPIGTQLDQIPVWVMREFLSYYLMPAWFDQIEWDRQSEHQLPNLMRITVSELLFDFENTLSKIKDFCNLNYQTPIEQLVPFHKKNLQLQQYIDHDRICNSIIESTLTNTELEWSPLTLPSEVWIQWELRNRGLEIRCHGLDIFPTNSIQLKELLYPV